MSFQTIIKGCINMTRQQHADARASSQLSPEVLQTIFRELDFSDLMNCQLVCKAWRLSIFGSDPVLRASLFRGAPSTDSDGDGDDEEEEEDYDDGDNGESENGVDDEGNDDYEEKEEEEDKEEDVRKLIIRLKVPIDVAKGPGKLPHLSFGLEVLFREEDEWMNDFEPAVNFDEDVVFHPFIESIESFMHRINPNFKENSRKGMASIFYFQTLDQLRDQTYRLDPSEYDDGSWRDICICSPAVERVQVEFRWPNKKRRSYDLEAPDDTGVTVGQFVDAARDMLAHAAEDVKGFAGNMEIYCRDCEHEIEAEEWNFEP